MQSVIRRISIPLVLAVSAAAVSWTASAEEVAPRPIDPGELYIGASGGFERMTAPEFKAVRLYRDDSDVTPDGSVTIEDHEGYLLKHRFKSTEKIPGLYVGYGFKNERDAKENGTDDSVIRVEVSVEAYNRKESSSDDFVQPPQDGYFVDDDSEPSGQREVGLATVFVPIDGKKNPTDDAGLALLPGAPLFDEEYKIKERIRSGSVTMYFDDRVGPWVFSRGVSFAYSYVDQEIDHEYVSLLLGLTPTEDPTHYFEYRSEAHNIGSRLHYSAGYELLRSVSIFTTGRFGFFARYVDFTGRQQAPCLSVCTVDLDNNEVGTRKLEAHDWKFAYDARMGGGASIRLGPVRVTAHGGGTRVGGWTTPRERQTKVKTVSTGGWGYFATASATIVFF